MKKFLSIILSILLIVSVVPMGLFTITASAATSGYYTYTVWNGEVDVWNGKVEITDCSTSISGNVTIPSTLGGYSVTRIGNSAFRDCTSLESVTIGNSVTRIGNSAFRDCTSLESVTIGNSVTSIGEGAFWGCTSLKSIYVDSNNRYYSSSDGVLFNKDKTELIQYPIGNTRTSYTIPESVTSIGEGAFYGCTNLTSITVDTNNQYYSSSDGVLFNKGKTKLIQYPAGNTRTSYTIPDSVTSIGEGAFYDCTNLINITIPNSVTSIGSSAFYGCTGLKNATIGNSVTSIGSSAFSGCTNLINITIPDSVRSIDSSAFYNTSYYNNSSNWENGVLYINNHLIDAKTNISGGYAIKEGTKTIAVSAFEDCTGLTSITIPNSVTRIGSSAFYGCKGLKNATIGNSVTSIGSSAFSGCTSLEDAYITDLAAWCTIDFIYADSNPLYYADNLYLNNILLTDDVVIPNGATKISSYAFYGYDKFTSITIPNSVTSIGSSAFYGCTGLKNATIGNSVTSIGSSAFSGCTNLINITIPDSVRSIDSSAFYNTSYYNNSSNWENGVLYINNHLIDAKTNISGGYAIKEGTKTIAVSAFEDCTRLTSITIPNSVTRIGSSAFYGCKGLKNATIGNSVTSIGSSAFSDCTSLEDAYITDLAAWCTIDFIYADSNPLYYADNLYLNNILLTDDVVIPNGATKISSYAFYGYDKFTSITIPNSVTSIGSSAFYGCTGLKNATIGNSVTSIGSSAFSGCKSLTSITIPDSVTRIGSSAFYGCKGLKNATIGNSVTSIGSSAFSGCTSLTSITIPNSVTSIGNYAFEGCTSLTSITIPDSVTNIGDYTFRNCSNLTSITIHDGMTSIGREAFYNCSNLTSITIPDSVTSIGNSAFKYCTSLKNATIGNSVTSIGSTAFFSCRSLENITIGNSVTSIGSSAFMLCTSLTSITIPDSITSIGSSAFYDCGRLESITLPFVGSSRTASGTRDAVFGYIFGYTSSSDYGTTKQYYSSGSSRYYYIPSSLRSVTITDTTQIPYGAFYGCSKLTSITIPDSVTSIGDSAFYDCSSLTSITIPDSVTSIGGSAFEGCSKLESITLPFVGSSRTASGTYDAVFGYIFGHTSYSSTGATCQYYSSGSYNYYYIPSSLKSVTITDTTQIPYGAFDNCSNLTSITIPDSVTSIGERAFYNCTSLEDVWYGGFKSEKKSIAIGSNNSSLTNATWHYKLCDSDHNYTLNGNCTCGSCGLSKAPAKPTLESKTNSSVTLMKTDGFEYSKDGTNWQTSNVFNNLSTSTTYTFYQRVKESTVAFKSDASEGLSVTFKEEQASIPNAPIVSSFTDTTVTLIPVANCEYSKDETTWQTSNVFDGLSSGTKYTLYLRYAETETHEASNSSAGTSITTDKAKQTLVPNAPTVQSFTSSSITLTPVDGCEYSKNGTTWQSSNVFGGLSCGTEYTFYQRYKETSTTYVGKSSLALVTKTDKGTQTAPAAPTLSSKTHSSVTLTLISGYEYSKDGINWQTSNVFTGLTPETNYMFYQRKAENDRYYVSSSSGSLTVKTLEQPQYTQGDLDGEEGVTDRDAVHLLYHTFLPDLYPVNQDCDFNKDGSVNDKDAVYLLYHTFLPDLYPLN